MRATHFLPLTLLAGLLLWSSPAAAQVDARLLRHPDVSETQITFVYGGDVWVVPKSGGTANRLSSPDGEEAFPRFSPDGETIAFSGNYDGNVDVYTVPAGGGVPTRVTHHGGGDRLVDWHPSGDSLLYATGMHSGRQRFNQLYRVSAGGGLPDRLPLGYGEFGAYSENGRYVAFTPETRVFRTWKRYRGGAAPDIWVYDSQTDTAEKLTDHPANDELPMWDGSTVYFLSDRGPNQRSNIWAKNRASGETRQVTTFADFDVHFPAIGPSDLVFEAGGDLYRMDLETEEAQVVDVDVVTDRKTVKPRTESVASQMRSAWVSPDGKRAVVGARGELFSLPAEHGVVRSLTRTSGTAERYPAWSPDGETIAYFSDASGEYELTLEPADGSGEPETVTDLGAGFRYQPYWSPESEKIAFIDEAMTVRIHDVTSGETTPVEQFPNWMNHYNLSTFEVSWSPDGRWLAYSRTLENDQSAVFVYDVEEEEKHQVTSGFYSTGEPTFGPEGNHLFVTTDRNFDPVYGEYDSDFVYPNGTHIAAIPLRDDVDSPLAPRNDEVSTDGEDENGNDDGEDDEGNEDDETVEIDLDGLEDRMVVLPAEPGNYPRLAASEGKVIYHRAPRTGSGDEQAPLVYFDLEEREEKTIIDDADDFVLSASGSKLLVRNQNRLAVIDVAEGQSMDDTLPTDEMEMQLDPREEWQQMFADAWRFQRDYFYDPTMHGVDWQQMRERYGALIDDAVTRSDVNFIIGELIAELNASHTYRGGGDDFADADRRSVGTLGVNWAVEDGAYRIDEIVRGAPWDVETRSPLDRSGVDVEEGDYVLAVNGRTIDPAQDPWAAFQGLAGKTVELTVNDEPSREGAERVVVEMMTTGEEERLRYLSWINQNRLRVEEATDGRVGYVYVPNTGIGGQTDLLRQWRAQVHKDALIIDERFNSGGQIPDRFVELLNRPPKAYWAVRHGEGFQTPSVMHDGPKTMLINGWSGSGGDAFPDYFRKADLGPLIGSRTWGGLIGISGAPALVDGGVATVPTFRMYNPDGTWFAEGTGVRPDIPVVNNPATLYDGTDQVLERAIDEMEAALEENNPSRPAPPAYEDRTAAPDRTGSDDG